MASKKPAAKTAAPTVSPAASGALTAAVMVALVSIAATTARGPAEFEYVAPETIAVLNSAGYVVTNPAIVNAEGAIATRASDAGIAAATAYAASMPAQAAPVAGGFGAVPSAAASAAPAAAKSSFALVSNVPVPDRKRGSIGPRSETYPFGTMEVGQAFFIPATADKPNPERSFASSVASATERYAQPKVPAEVRTNRKGREVAVTVRTRTFRIARVEDGAPFGQPGVAGAGVWRMS